MKRIYSISATFAFFFFCFLLDLFLAGILKTFYIQIIRFLFYMQIIRNNSLANDLICGMFLMLESFLMFGILGLDLCCMVPLVGILYLLKDTFDNHWILQTILALVCYAIHGYCLTLLTNV